MRHAAALYAIGVSLLTAVFLFGVTKKGSTRWLNIVHDFQPSEMMKIAMPMMLAWFFHRADGAKGWQVFAVAAVLLAIPVGLIAKQPDFGTAMLVMAAGFYVIVLAGLSWRVLAGAITMILFTYAFINIGMVCGVVPVVGVPLPFFSFGGTALGTLGVGCGILMNIRRQSAAGLLQMSHSGQAVKDVTELLLIC